MQWEANIADPFTIILGAVGAAVSAFGSISAGQASANAANYNAQVAEQNAQRARAEGSAAAEQKVRENRRALGLQRAAIGESGFGYSGSLFDISQQSAANAELDVLTLAYEGEAAARGQQNRAALYRTEADAERTQGYIGGASKLLSPFSTGTGYGRPGLWV